MASSLLSSDMLFWTPFFLLLIVAMVIDARSYKIPNWSVLALALTGIVVTALQRPELLVNHLGVAALTLFFGFGLYRLTGFGAGDAKIWAAIMLWLGSAGIIPFLFVFGICSAFLVLILLAGRTLGAGVMPVLQGWEPFTKGASVPLALAISPAAMIVAILMLRGITYPF